VWLAERFGYRGCWSFPVRTAVGKFVGTFALYFPHPRAANEHDCELISHLTRSASIIVTRDAEL
jgi:hypothetical protein